MTVAEKQIVEKIKVLSSIERDEVLRYVDELLSKQHKKVKSKTVVENDKNTQQMAWLKTNRDKYAGQYVALVGDVLVAHADNLQEIRKQTKGKNDLFITKVFAEETIVSAGL